MSNEFIELFPSRNEVSLVFPLREYGGGGVLRILLLSMERSLQLLLFEGAGVACEEVPKLFTLGETS